MFTGLCAVNYYKEGTGRLTAERRIQLQTRKNQKLLFQEKIFRFMIKIHFIQNTFA